MITVERWFGFVAALFLGTFALIACGENNRLNFIGIHLQNLHNVMLRRF